MTTAKKNNGLKNWLEYLGFSLLMWLIKITPQAWGVWIGKQLGLLAYRVLKDRRVLTQENLIQAHEQGYLKATTDIKLLARQVWENIGVVGSRVLILLCPRLRTT